MKRKLVEQEDGNYKCDHCNKVFPEDKIIPCYKVEVLFQTPDEQIVNANMWHEVVVQVSLTGTVGLWKLTRAQTKAKNSKVYLLFQMAQFIAQEDRLDADEVIPVIKGWEDKAPLFVKMVWANGVAGKLPTIRKLINVMSEGKKKLSVLIESILRIKLYFLDVDEDLNCFC